MGRGESVGVRDGVAMAWLRSWTIDEDGVRIPGTPIHVCPDYGRTHTKDGCWCEPQPDLVEPLMIVHQTDH